jgi:hypothetical protein
MISNINIPWSYGFPPFWLYRLYRWKFAPDVYTTTECVSVVSVALDDRTGKLHYFFQLPLTKTTMTRIFGQKLNPHEDQKLLTLLYIIIIIIIIIRTYAEEETFCFWMYPGDNIFFQ